jgi:hypothetical protein
MLPTPLPDNGYRDVRQTDAHRWCARTFGVDCATDKGERIRRFIEEALELAQACDLPRSAIWNIMEHVYSRPVGEPFQEAGGVGVTLLILCESIGISADHAERTELARVLAKPAQHFRDRHNQKAAAGIGKPIADEAA